MAYRHDPDLEFLGKLKSSDLNDLVRCLTHDKDGSARLTDELTMSDLYKKYAPDHNRYWQIIAAEVQCFGGNTFATMFRGGKGVTYKEVLCDVCDKLDVNYSKKSSVETIEGNLLMKILQDALAKMTPEQLREPSTCRPRSPPSKATRSPATPTPSCLTCFPERKLWSGPR
ncbi:DUF3944 domain-containing protein [Cupriavidus necator]|uniref:DUF3944 domain-containing protein n=1 Tax=Cupriavidus necator TaxID=106590 RepID=UPI0022A84DAE|nr:DUF3944 domain-containing protein [Cupriavidus necator]